MSMMGSLSDQVFVFLFPLVNTVLRFSLKKKKSGVLFGTMYNCMFLLPGECDHLASFVKFQMHCVFYIFVYLILL